MGALVANTRVDELVTGETYRIAGVLSHLVLSAPLLNSLQQWWPLEVYRDESQLPSDWPLDGAEVPLAMGSYPVWFQGVWRGTTGKAPTSIAIMYPAGGVQRGDVVDDLKIVGYWHYDASAPEYPRDAFRSTPKSATVPDVAPAPPPWSPPPPVAKKLDADPVAPMATPASSSTTGVVVLSVLGGALLVVAGAVVYMRAR